MKKIISIALAVLLIATLIPMAVFADESNATDIVDVTGKAAGDKITLGGVEYTLIDSADDVVAANGNYYLMNDITLTTYFLAEKDNGNNNEVDESTFVGKFNGGGHTITLDGAKSVFGKWFGGEGSLFANITLATKDNAVFAPGGWGGPLGFYACKGGLFYNITNNINIETTAGKVGGLVGGISAGTAPAEFVNCVNNGTVKAGGSNAGLVGYVNNKCEVSMKNCVNNGKVVSTAAFGAGGLVGYIAACTVIVEDSVNNGDVETVSAYAGGILGGAHKPQYNAQTVKIKNCVNFGNVSTTGSSTYMVGAIHGGSTYAYNIEVEITSCVNFGNVTTQGNRAAAFLVVNSTGTRPSPYGDSMKAKFTLTDCYNAGTITTTGNAPVAFVQLAVFSGSTDHDGDSETPNQAVDFVGSATVSKCYTTVEMENLVSITGSEAFTKTVDEDTVGTTTLAKVVAAANKTGALEDTLYVKDGEVKVCEAHEFVNGACKNCATADPNYVAPNPPAGGDDPVTPPPTGDITVFVLAVAVVALAGVCVAKKKIKE